MRDQSWLRRNRDALVVGVIVCAVWALLTYLVGKVAHVGIPLFYGLTAAAMTLVAGLAVLIFRQLPRPRMIPTTKNIEVCVRTWLDSHKVAVKNDPGNDLDFRFRITLDSGKQLTVLRSLNEFTDYVQILADLGMRGDDLKLLDRFSNDEKEQVLYDMRLELARAKVGYSNLIMPPENFFIFRRVPIFSGLTEYIFMAMIGDIEAAMNLVFLKFLKALQQADARTGKTSSIGMPSTSDEAKTAVSTS